MSRLWPDRFAGGLFPGHCWLGSAGREALRLVPTAEQGTPSAMLQALDDLLAGQGEKLRPGARISLVVSDSLAALAVLPWHPELSTPAEVRAYALACFERQGIVIADRWVMHAEFRTHRGMGLAYALPREWIEGVVELLAARGLQLDRALPLSAMAYWRHRPAARTGTEMLLLREQQRLTALLYGRSGLLGMDVEAVTGAVDNAGQRLLRRITAYQTDVAVVWDWSVAYTDEKEERAQPGYVAQCLPDAILKRIAGMQWGKP